MEYARKISQNIDLIIVGFPDDELFDFAKMRAYFEEVAQLRHTFGHT